MYQNINRMRRLMQGFIILLCLFVFLPIVFAETAAKSEGYRDFTKEEIAEYVDEFIRKTGEKYHLPYMGMAVVYNSDQIYTGAVGFEDIENKIKADPKLSRFSIGSSSKICTYIALMQLAEHGEIDLNENVFSYLDFDLKLEHDKPVRIIDLMNHQGGFEDRIYNLKANSLEDIVPLELWLQENTPKQVFEPGTYTAYSNYGIALLGQVVASVSGMRYEDYIQRNIFDVLGMDNSTCEQYVTDRLVRGYSYDSATDKYVLQDYEYWHIPPAGSMRTTPEDMAKLCVAMLNEGTYNRKSIMSAESMKQLQETSYAPGEELNGLAHGIMEFCCNGYDYLSHGGTTSYQHSSFCWFKELGIGFYITGGCDEARAANSNFILEFINTFYEPVVRKYDYIEGLDLSRYAGSYYMARSSYSTFEKIVRWMNSETFTTDGESLVVAPGVHLKPVSERYFTSEDGNNRFLFDLDEKGRVSGLCSAGAPITYFFKQHGAAQNSVQFIFLGIFFSTLLVTGMIRLVKLVIRKIRKIENIPGKAAERRFSNLLTGYALVTILLLAAFFLTIDLVAILKGNILPVRILSILFMLLIPLTVWQFVRTLRIVKDAGAALKFKIAESVISVSTAGIIIWLLYWKLIGIPYLF